MSSLNLETKWKKLYGRSWDKYEITTSLKDWFWKLFWKCKLLKTATLLNSIHLSNLYVDDTYLRMSASIYGIKRIICVNTCFK